MIATVCQLAAQVLVTGQYVIYLYVEYLLGPIIDGFFKPVASDDAHEWCSLKLS